MRIYDQYEHRPTIKVVLSCCCQLVPASGHTIHASHIESPDRLYRVQWKCVVRPSAVNGVMWDSGNRWCFVKAVTPHGALDIAKYHYGSNGYDFELLLTNQNNPSTFTQRSGE